MTAPAPDPRRLKLSRAIHAAARAKGLDDDTYRGLLVAVTGKASSKDLTLPEMGQVLDRLNAGTARPRNLKPQSTRPQAARPKPRSPQAMKAKALWLSLYQLGAVRSSTDAALAAFAGRVVHANRAEAHLDWLRPADLNRVVEALKSWCAREGFDVPDDVMAAKRDLLRALWGKLVAVGSTPGGIPSLGWWFARKFQVYPSRAQGKTLDRAAEALGEFVRAIPPKPEEPQP